MIKKGDLLLSEPYLNDPAFHRSVILMCDHEAKGSFGFVLNQLSNLVLDDFGDRFQNLETPVFIGGPVEQNTLFFVHLHGDKIEGATQITEQIYWGGNLDETLKLLKLDIIKENQIRFFIGYSGWSAGQLMAEMKINSWLQIENFTKNLFEFDYQNLWREVLKIKGGKYKGFANYPIDPRLN